MNNNSLIVYEEGNTLMGRVICIKYSLTYQLIPLTLKKHSIIHNASVQGKQRSINQNERCESSTKSNDWSFLSAPTRDRRLESLFFQVFLLIAETYEEEDNNNDQTCFLSEYGCMTFKPLCLLLVRVLHKTREKQRREGGNGIKKKQHKRGKRETLCWAYVDDVSSVPREFRTSRYRCVSLFLTRS